MRTVRVNPSWKVRLDGWAVVSISERVFVEHYPRYLSYYCWKVRWHRGSHLTPPPEEYQQLIDKARNHHGS